MISFIKRVVLFLFSFLIIYVLIYISIDYYNNHKRNDSVFIWGDSMTYWGLDLKIMTDLGEKNVFSSAKPGSGVYDFLVFTEAVPKNSTVLIAISKLTQLRPKNLDRNLSGINLNALLWLYNEGYTFTELLEIINKNKRPAENFVTSVPLFPYSHKIIFAESISLFKKIYLTPKDYLRSKQNLYLKGIENLQKKNCKISFIEFPYHPILEMVENKSALKSKTTAFKQELLKQVGFCEIDTIRLSKNPQKMHDLTHLNDLGAKIVSTELIYKMKKHVHTTLYVVYYK